MSQVQLKISPLSMALSSYVKIPYAIGKAFGGKRYEYPRIQH